MVAQRENEQRTKLILDLQALNANPRLGDWLHQPLCRIGNHLLCIVSAFSSLDIVFMELLIEQLALANQEFA